MTELVNRVDELGFVDPIGDLGHDQARGSGFLRLDGDFTRDVDTAPAGQVDVGEALGFVNDAAGREIRARNEAQKTLNGTIWMLDAVNDGARDLFKVVGRDLGGHADGDAARPIDEEVRETARQNGRLKIGVVKGERHVDRVPVDVADEFGGKGGKTRFRVTVGGRAITIHGAIVALKVDQGGPDAPSLGHANQSLVNRGVAVRMVFAHDLSDDVRAFLGRFLKGVARFPHRVDDAALNGFHPVSGIGDRAVLDDILRVDIKTFPHQVVEGARNDHFGDDRGFGFFLRHYSLTSLMKRSSSLNTTFSSIQARRLEASLPMRTEIRFSTTIGSSILTW